ncbi:alanine/ornithine racemase family PLP-dependent enzyme [Aminipila butyrica]|uniref:Alanine/ornithine racemase family PLP-dependent enzyme n=1 Tax=Aminipila butyrica TaxID=433296 RepID=A0A858BSX9_9FIRM|nr:alanine racemase [Aminipila butyrica]QIB69091.1 alanine/ornithine racemase family PLP-dependent enzyme [Aminipila butyrica]
METYSNYPVLEINLDGIYHNAKAVVDMCREKSIQVTGVVKGTDSYENSYAQIAAQMLHAGCTSIGDSRINTIKRMRQEKIDAPIFLIRVPMACELKDVITYTDISLNSEIATIKALNQIAYQQNKNHKVILMMDLGDLREGYIQEEELIKDALFIENQLKDITLYGVGTNLGCFGSIKPNNTNLSTLVSIADKISAAIGRKLDIVSGGATSTLPLVLDGTIPKGINHLRVGEGIVNARDLQDIWGLKLPMLRRDNYMIKAQVVEIKEKPSYPIGEIFVDAFGNTPEYFDKGIRKRALIALGKRDVGDIFSVLPKLKGATVEGGSSDHLILDVTDCESEISLGDIIPFEACYGAMIHATYSSSVTKQYISV